MQDNKLLGSATGSSMEIALDALGAPGAQGVLIIKAMFNDRDNDDPIRLGDITVRDFEVKAKLSRGPASPYELNGTFNQNDGSSYLLVTAETQYMTIDCDQGSIRLDINQDRQIAMASSTIAATTARQVQAIFADMLTLYLDRMSYLARIPAYVSLTVVRDVKHEVQYMYYVSAPRPATVGSGGEALATEMKAIYSLYREGMNATSPYYRVLCFHKIMEGLLGPLRTAVQRRARAAKFELRNSRDRVPDHPDFPAGLRSHIGTPLKAFFDGFLSKQFRDAMAHFTLRERNPLDLSSHEDLTRFIDVSFVADLCVRELISKHEMALFQLNTLERSGSLAGGNAPKSG